MNKAVNTQVLFPKSDKAPEFEMHIIDGRCYVDYLVYADLWHRYQKASVSDASRFIDLLKVEKERDELKKQLNNLQAQPSARRNTIKDFRCKMSIVKGGRL